MSTQTPPYYVSKDTYLCLSHGRVIFLDLARNNYHGLQISDAGALGTYVRGWPDTSRNSTSIGVVEQLIAAGMLTRDPVQGRADASPVRYPEPDQSLDDFRAEAKPHLHLLDVLRFLISAWVCSVALRLLPFKSTVAYIRRRKRPDSPFDMERAKNAIAVFDGLFPVFFSRSDECLRNSLLLVHFLGHYRLYPDWVFAVRGTPFLAHCWVQHGTIALNDTLKSTLGMTPILVI